MKTLLHASAIILFSVQCGVYKSSSIEISNRKEKVNIQKEKILVKEYAPVFSKLKKGVNQDVNLPSSGMWLRVQHHPGHMQAIKEAGFESVRIFISYHGDIEQYSSRIQDALDNNLAVVVCLWGKESWAIDKKVGINEISSRWRTLAQSWKELPNDVVFEILNETEGIGFKDKSMYSSAMKLYNASVTAIREVDPDRPILIGAPGYNDSDKLDPWVSEKYLTYTLSDGSGFFDDPNIGVAIHFYRPNRANGNNFAMWTEPLRMGWKSSINYEINNAVAWRKKHNTNIPIIVTEWGCWLFENRNGSADLSKWLDYHIQIFEKNNFGSMWYTGIQSNQRQFSIFDSELGWNKFVLDKITGFNPSKIPATPQLIDSEFFYESKAWQLTSSRVERSIIRLGAINGKSSIKLEVPETMDCQMYQETLNFDNKGKQAPGRTLLHLIKNKTYKISFMARSESNGGLVKIMLKDADNLEIKYYESELIKISKTTNTYAFKYTHKAPSAMNVRFEFDIGLKKQTLILDNVVFIRE